MIFGLLIHSTTMIFLLLLLVFMFVCVFVCMRVRACVCVRACWCVLRHLCSASVIFTTIFHFFANSDKSLWNPRKQRRYNYNLLSFSLFYLFLFNFFNGLTTASICETESTIFFGRLCKTISRNLLILHKPPTEFLKNAVNLHLCVNAI